MKLRTTLRYRIFFLSLWRGIGLPIILSLPILISATSSVWLKWLITILPSDISKWVNDSYDKLISIFGILAGICLTLIVSFLLKEREDRKNNITSKEFKFYTPIFTEINEIYKKRKEEDKVIDFHTTSKTLGGIRVKWEFWHETNTSLIKCDVPNVFKIKIDLLDTLITKYMSSYIIASKFSNDYIFSELNSIGIQCHYSSFLSTLEKVYYCTLTEASYMNKINGKDNIPIDKEIINKIVTVIKESPEYKEFIRDLDEMTDMLEEILEGLDYILTRIHRKYKGSNILL